VAALALGVAWQMQSSGPDHRRPEVLGISMERSTLSTWSEEFALGPTTTTTSAPRPPSADATVATVAPTSPSVTAQAVAPPAVMSADGMATTSAPVGTQAAPSSGGDVVTRAIDLVYFDWRDGLPGWTIQFMGPRVGMRGATFPQDKVVQVYVRPDESAADVAHAFAHELGHAIDVTYLNAHLRVEFNQARGRPSNFGWWVSAGADDFASGAGDWAECFAWTMTHGVGAFYSRLGPRPDDAVMALIGQLDH